ncbi:aminotransferase class V-fold PLP-dependent enzyme [Noviherbaspirillum sp. ST9]|uniref:aminotransferase class V-fold PLP-dependent enzyme n=1 Tax=Noviherbaspirillum sp. ST9 TaxID=3401606 RepID=UPI003B5882DE
MTQHIEASDERYWLDIRSQYEPSPDFINLENGYFGMASRPVMDALEAYNLLVNREAAFFMRTKYPQRLADVVQSLAAFFGVSADEVLVVRNPTEGMNILIQGYPFGPDDEVVVADQDYDSVKETLTMMEQRGRFRLAPVQLPFHPVDDEEILAAYRKAITPKTRVLIVTHLLHRTGQILPVAKIARMAQDLGIDVFVDAAHSFAHIDYRLPELQSSFVVVHLHKWLGAPLGVGMLYIRSNRVRDIAPLYGDTSHAAEDIRKLARFGTTPPGPILAIEDAIAFHNRIGGRNKEARLRYLKECWVNEAKTLQRIELMIPDAPERSCGIAAFRVKDRDAQAVVDYLLAEHRIFTVAPMVGTTRVVRVTPHLYNTPEEMAKLVHALRQLP